MYLCVGQESYVAYLIIDIMKKKNTLLLFLCLFSLWAVAQEKKPVKIACVGKNRVLQNG